MILLFGFVSGELFAQDPVPKREQRKILRKVKRIERKIEREKKQRSFIVLPAVYYTPETRWAGGVTGFAMFKTKLDSTTFYSQIAGNAIYTLNDQIILSAPYRIYTPGNNYLFQGELSFYRYPYIFGGIGNDHEVDVDLEKYTAAFPRINFGIYRDVYKGFYIGAKYFYQNVTMTERDFDGVLRQKTIVGSSGGVTSGVGLALLYTNKDYEMSPTKGTWLKLSNTHFSKTLGSDFSYDLYELDLRGYTPIFKKHVFAAQFLSEWNYGNPPFNRLAMLGGTEMMRGFQQGVFRDMRYTALQAELRSKVYFNFLGFVAFTGVGGVGATSQQITDNLRLSYGGGVRILADKKRRLFIRFDAGFGKDTNGFYFNIGEAF
tara:strand:+ start:9962 stop:11086 length:1125 start_codon:yes stop_codon:yes gene_type:complete